MTEQEIVNEIKRRIEEHQETAYSIGYPGADVDDAVRDERIVIGTLEALLAHIENRKKTPSRTVEVLHELRDEIQNRAVGLRSEWNWSDEDQGRLDEAENIVDIVSDYIGREEKNAE